MADNNPQQPRTIHSSDLAHLATPVSLTYTEIPAPEFTRGFGNNYNAKEVDQWVNQVQTQYAAMFTKNEQQQRLISDLRDMQQADQVKFGRYDQQISQLQTENKELNDKIENKYKHIGETAQRFFDAARNEGEQVAKATMEEAQKRVAAAQAQADKMRAEADEYANTSKAQADRTLAEAQKTAGNMVDQAKQAAAQTVASAKETAANLSKMANEQAQDTRNKADEYAKTTRAQADQYAQDTRSKADAYQTQVENDCKQKIAELQKREQESKQRMEEVQQRLKQSLSALSI